MIRAPFIYRLMVLVLVAALLGTAWRLIASDADRPWAGYQARYRAQYLASLDDRVRRAESAGDKAALRKWRAMRMQVAEEDLPAVQAVYIPEAGIQEMCRTCHLAMENPLFKGSGKPFGAHPGKLLITHPPERFGCTVCHQGQGAALDREKAHGFEPNWPRPRVPMTYVEGLCYGCHPITSTLSGAEKAERGRRRFIEFGCYGCHQVNGMPYLQPVSPALDRIGSKIRDTRWLAAWLAQPTAIRPDTRMPVFQLKPEEIRQVTAYLSGNKARPGTLKDFDAAAASPEKGKTLFVETGCIGCHSNERGQRSVNRRVPNLADAGLKLSGQWVPAWLARPAKWDPNTPMPELMLSEAQCRDLAAYVLTLRAEAVWNRLKQTPRPTGEKADAAKGKQLVQHYGCYGCHPVKAFEDAPAVGVEVASMADKRIGELAFGNADVPKTKWDWLYNKIRKPDIYKTRDMPLKMPDYSKLEGFSAQTVEALTTFYLHHKPHDVPAGYRDAPDEADRVREKGVWMIEQYHCAGCHQFDADGKPRIRKHLALKSMVPPRLVDEGERVQPQWLFQFLSRPVELRPWLKIRMPVFGWKAADREDVIAYFALENRSEKGQPVPMPYVRIPVAADYEREIIDMGKYRVTEDKCVQCHPVSKDQKLPEKIKLSDLSINLMLSKSRLRFEWIKRFLRDPDRFAGKETKMPYVYYTPDGVPRISDPDMWIEYAALYLMFMNEPPEMPKEEKIEEVRPGSSTDWTSY